MKHHALKARDVYEYALVKGWKLAADDADWALLHGPLCDDGTPLEIILHWNIDRRDGAMYMHSAINILASEEEIPIWELAARITLYAHRSYPS